MLGYLPLRGMYLERLTRHGISDDSPEPERMRSEAAGMASS